MAIPHIFITQSSHDIEKSTKIRDYLESQGIPCWMAPRDIPVGEEWAEAILNGIETASGMLLVFSSHSNNSPQVRREIERAINKGIPIFPVRIESVDPSKAMEYYISSSHWMDAFKGSLDDNLSKLVSAIKAKTPSLVQGAQDENSAGMKETSSESRSDRPDTLPGSSKTDEPGIARWMRRSISNRIAVVAVALVSVASVLLLKGTNTEYESFTDDIEDLSAFEPLMVRLQEDGCYLTATSIESTLDGGYILTGRRESLDESEDWLEIWLKKLDRAGNEEWEYTDRDSLGLFRVMNAIELSDSTFACAFSIPMIDTLLPRGELRYQYANFRDYIHSDTTFEGDGVGFTISLLSTTGELLDREFIRWERGVWEKCRVHEILQDANSIFVVVDGRNENYHGTTHLLLSFSDRNLKNYTQFVLGTGTSFLSTVNITDNILSYCMNDINHWCNYIKSVDAAFLDHTDSEYIASLPFRSSRDDFVGILRTPEIEPYISNLRSLLNVRYISDSIIYSNSLQFWHGETITRVLAHSGSGEFLWDSSVDGIYQTLIPRIAPLDDFAFFAGSTIDSSNVQRPFLGMLDSQGTLLWSKTLPLTGSASDFTEDRHKTVTVAVNSFGVVHIIRMDHTGYYADDTLLNDRTEFIEDWSKGEIDTNLWDAPSWGCTVAQMESGENALRVISGSGSSINLRKSFLLQLLKGISCNVYVPRSIEGTMHVCLRIVRLDIATEIAELRWNFGVDECPDYMSNSLVFSAVSHEVQVIPDQNYVNYGEWNDFSLTMNGNELIWFANGSQIAGMVLDDVALEAESGFFIEVYSGVTPVFIGNVSLSTRPGSSLTHQTTQSPTQYIRIQ